MARNYLELAADQADPHARHMLGLIHTSGLGVESNGTKANELFLKAIEGGNMAAYSGLGYIYLEGIGVEKDVKKAIGYYE